MSPDPNYQTLDLGEGKFVRMWNKAVGEFEPVALEQLRNTGSMPFVKGLAAMPDCHFGRGATVGSVILTQGAVIPAAVGVDIGCGMCALKTSLTADDLPDSLAVIRSGIERRVPMGFAVNRKLQDDAASVMLTRDLPARLQGIVDKHPKLLSKKLSVEKVAHQLGSLGGGNHFIEVCLDKAGKYVWVMLHSGSRGIGNKIGNYFIAKAKQAMQRYFVTLPDDDLAYLPDGSQYYADYIEAMTWAQDFAYINRQVMLQRVLTELRYAIKPFEITQEAINCHHNYAVEEKHQGMNMWVTRKGAVRARKGDLGIIPSAMGQPSYIVEGLGSEAAFHSCSHGAGRAMSRTAAKQTITLEEHTQATLGVECLKDNRIIDESPAAYKNIAQVMASQADLVTVKEEIKAVLCCKGV